MKETTQTTAEKQSRKKLILILIGAGTGILLLLVGSGWFSSSKKTTAAPSPPTASQELEEYRSSVEARVAALCSSVSGVGEVRVAVSLAGGFETVYATETRNGSEIYATVGSGSNAEALVIARNPPEITGIGVVCRGGGNQAIRGELTSLLASAFRVPSNRIYITEGKK